MKTNSIQRFILPAACDALLWLRISLVIVLIVGNLTHSSNAQEVKPILQSQKSNTNNDIYSKRYSDAILRGVNLSDVFTINGMETADNKPAYANVWTSPPNFIQCMPPTGRKFSYALCYYSGPDSPTGNKDDNPALPCKLSPDGVVADCSCYEISTDEVSPKIPYFVDIHAISNLYIYQETVNTCGTDGTKCFATDRDPPVCDAINTNLMVPGADLISVFSPIYTNAYSTDSKPRSTDCKDAAVYAGCMTAPCYRTGEKDAQGRDIVQCKCPVYDGPYQIGQAGPDINCNANKTSSETKTSSAQNGKRPGNNVWSAAYNPNGAPINPPDGACVPDLPGEHGCGLYEPDKIYNINPKGALCKNVCNAYEKSTSGTGSNQVGYSCDATLCTTLGIGQENNPDFSPSQKAQAGLLKEACSGIQDINGMKEIMLVEALAECSCCASQVCGCDKINQETNQEVYDLNKQQRAVTVEPQCNINKTLCGQP